MTEHQAPNMKRTVPLQADFSDEMVPIKPLHPYDVVFLIASRDRPGMLHRILDDLYRHFTPAVTAAGLTYAVGVYAQNYTPAFLDQLDGEAKYPLFLVRADTEHQTIGSVVHAAAQAVDFRMEQTVGWTMHDAKVVITLDDDSVFTGDARVNANITTALQQFIRAEHVLHCVRLGTGTTLQMRPLVEASYPVLPGKEKMQWMQPKVLFSAIDQTGFDKLTLGEDAVISLEAWATDPHRCFSTFGFGTFVHLGLEGHLSPVGFELTAGLESLPEPAKHFGPQQLHPDIFVPDGHPLYDFYGIRPEVLDRMLNHGRTEVAFDLGG